ncbi:MAG TPA: rhodanese-like domain-containing protein [Planctomycetota bacterium]|nr:rhodanese-like domain-containing protein [Planctomycetota bacterium]
MTKTAEIRPDSSMAEILKAYPGAQRALFQGYHIGGCSSCGFQPTDTLEQVLKNHNVLDVSGAIAFIQKCDEMDRRLQIPAKEVADWRKREARLRLIDVRSPEEHEIARIEGATLLSGENVDEIRALPKDTPIVFHCHHGMRSLDAAAYFAGHGFTVVRSMTGGIDAWSREVDPRVPRY